MKKLLQVSMAGFLSVGICMAANAVDSEDAIEYRQAVMTLIKWNVGQMGAMVKGKIPFDVETFAKKAANLDLLSQMPLEGFTPGSDKGYTNAEPSIWTNWNDFKAKMAEFQQEAAKLQQKANDLKKATEPAEAAKTATTQGDVASQFVNMLKTCKGCHKIYKR